MNNELEIIKQREESLKKILVEAKSCIDKAEVLNDSNNKRLDEIKEKLITKGIDTSNLKQEIINNIENCNKNLNEIYDSISFKMLDFYKRIDLNICDKYLELNKNNENINYNSFEDIQKKIDILKEKISIVEIGLEQSKTVRDTAIGKEEHLKARKLDIENKIIEKGIEPKNIEMEIINRKNKLDLLQKDIYENLNIVMNVFESQNAISKDILNEWKEIQKNLFDNKEVNIND